MLTCFCLSGLIALNNIFPVTGAPSPLEDDLELGTISPSLCSNLTAVVWCPFCGLVLEFSLFDYVSLVVS